MRLHDFVNSLRGRYLYHFTEAVNLPSIRKHGILSWAELRRRNIPCERAGGNELSRDLDAYRGLEDYVHLCLHNEHPMEYRAREEGRLQNTKFIPILPAIILKQGVKFSRGVANANDAKLLPMSTAVRSSDIELFFSTQIDWNDELQVSRRKAEILVPQLIQTHFLVLGE